MEQEAFDPAGTDPTPGDSDRGPAAGGRSEVERLRRENRRLEARLESEERRRERLIDRYEALLPDGSEADATPTNRPDRRPRMDDSRRTTSPAGPTGAADATAGDGAGAAGPDRGVASAVGYAAWSAATWARRGLRALRARR